MGSRGVGIMNLTAFLFLANSSPEIDESQKMELTIGSLSFYIGSLSPRSISTALASFSFYSLFAFFSFKFWFMLKFKII
jgi:hypothetical protein